MIYNCIELVKVVPRAHRASLTEYGPALRSE